MEKYIRKLLLNLGIRSTYQGFRYLQYALLLCLENDEYLRSICKFLYPDIAKKFSTTVDNVEHFLLLVSRQSQIPNRYHWISAQR